MFRADENDEKSSGMTVYVFRRGSGREVGIRSRPGPSDAGERVGLG
jgi:hypothetical protein